MEHSVRGSQFSNICFWKGIPLPRVVYLHCEKRPAKFNGMDLYDFFPFSKAHINHIVTTIYTTALFPHDKLLSLSLHTDRLNSREEIWPLRVEMSKVSGIIQNPLISECQEFWL